nr:phage major capsid protein [uncultured Mediterraneibacter sp.]
MKIEGLSQEVKDKVKQLLDNAPADQKADAIMQSIEMIEEAAHADLIQQVVAEAERAGHDAEFKKQLGLRNLSQEEKKFYEGFKDIKQSITANQIDIIPTEIIDRTLDDVKKASPILKLVNMAPANVKKWIVASHSGTAVWGMLTDEIKGELSAEVTALNIEIHMLSAYLVIPKAIRELSLEFVDRYFMAILSEAMQDGLVKGYLDGDGKTGPIGIFRQIGTTNGDGTQKAKTVSTKITKFSPKGLAEVRKTLTNDGKRVVSKLYLICNPADEAEYVDPCMYGEALTGGYVNKSFIEIEKIVDANCPKGKAAFTIEGYYTMGTTGVRVNEYDQTKAMENADLIIATCFANGRAVDDNVAVVFDVTKLEEYVLPVTQITIPQQAGE